MRVRGPDEDQGVRRGFLVSVIALCRATCISVGLPFNDWTGFVQDC